MFDIKLRTEFSDLRPLKFLVLGINLYFDYSKTVNPWQACSDENSETAKEYILLVCFYLFLCVVGEV